MITELDQQLLDEFLDGQLPPTDAQRLARRLSAEPLLAEELSVLRTAREIRQNVFSALAPEPAMADAFTRRVMSASRRQALRTRFGGMTRVGGGIAACIAIGFLAGWFGRGHNAATSPIAQTPSMVSRTADHSPTVAVAENSDRANAPAGPLTKFQVTLTDPDGKVLAVQKFDRIEDAAAAVDAMQHRTQSSPDTEAVVDAAQF